ncbi:MAG TPA: cytochrome c3 family protein [Polyangia bacterium]|jgi:hypothetical protein
MQLFSRRADLVTKLVIGVLVVGLGGLIWAFTAWFWQSDWYTRRGMAATQPVPFSHQHHVGGDGLDCRYCHQLVTESSSAGMPTTETCMTCHWQIWTEAPVLAPVRASWQTGQRLFWKRNYDLPDYVYFDHSIHIAKGVGCATCHGRVDQMPLIQKAATLEMRWCLACHRQPEKHLRPRSEVFRMDWKPPPDQEEQGRRLVKEYQVRSLTSCSHCHR